jgi:DNA-binding CsgD family transcriptional regulator
MPYMKVNFGDLVLTAKEQLYIEFIIFNIAHKEIAHRQDVSETSVRKLLSNIKRKLENESMSNSTLLPELRRRGVLEIFSNRLIESGKGKL